MQPLDDRTTCYTFIFWYFETADPCTTLRPKFAIECLRRSNQQGGGSLWANILGCSPWSRPVMLGLQRANIG